MKVFTTGQVAKICKVAPRTVSKWFDSGRLKGYRIPGSQDRRIPREYLIKFLKEHGMPLGDLEDEAMAKVLVVGQDQLLIEALLEPTRIYARSLLPLIRGGLVHALAHITGGGLLENIPRILPGGLHARIDADAWPQPRLMAFLQAQGNIEPEEMARTFNCDIGMAVVVDEADAAEVIRALEAAGETVHRIGRIEQGDQGCTVAGSAESWSARGPWTAIHHG